jgi:cytochrome d ubiquinol oxidase subunit II
VPVGNATGSLIDSWVNPTSIALGIVAILTGAHLAAVFLTGDARRADLPDMVTAFRTRAIGSGVVAGAAALVTLFVVRSDARSLYDGLTSGDGLIAVLGSALFGVLTITLVATGRYGPARFAAAAAVGAMTVGWALAQDPYILPGQLTLDDAAASDTTLVTLVVSVGVGLLVLVPSLWWLYRLVLRGTLDQDYEPLDQRFRPVDS